MNDKKYLLFCKNCLKPFETDYDVEKGFPLMSSIHGQKWYKLNEVDIYCLFCSDLSDENETPIHFAVIKEFEKTRIIALFKIKKNEKRKTKYSDIENIPITTFKEEKEE